MLLNDTLLNEDSFRNGLRESPVRDCDEERETVSHFLLRCPHYDEIRNKLQNVVDDIWTVIVHFNTATPNSTNFASKLFYYVFFNL